MNTTAEKAVRETPLLMCGEMVRKTLAGEKTQTRRVIAPQPEPDPAGHIECFVWKGGRRLIQAGYGADYVHTDRDAMERAMVKVCPYGQPGDRLWVRETWAATVNVNEQEDWPACPHLHHEDIESRFPGFEARFGFDAIIYAATPGKDWVWCDEDGGMTERSFWKPSIHMPRWASRLTLEIVSVRAEPVQDITEAGAKAEGIEGRWHPDDPHCWTWKDYERTARFGEPFFHYGSAVTPQTTFAGLWNTINAKRGFGWDVNPWVWVVEFRRIQQ